MSSKKNNNSNQSTKEPKREYRSFFVAMHHEEVYQSLSCMAQLQFYHLKGQLGPSGIGVLYPAALAEFSTDATPESVEKAMQELEEAGWVRRQGPVVWLVEGLKHEPNLSLAPNSNHRVSVQNYLAQLPKWEIVNEFAAFYGLDLPFPKLRERKGKVTPIRPTETQAIAGPSEVRMLEPHEVEYNENTLLGCVRTFLYVDRKEPEGWDAGRDREIIRAMLERGVNGREIAEAIQGLGMMRDHGKMTVAKPGEGLTTRLLYNKHHGVLDLFQLAREHRQTMLGQKAGTDEALMKVVAGIKKEVA